MDVVNPVEEAYRTGQIEELSDSEDEGTARKKK